MAEFGYKGASIEKPEVCEYCGNSIDGSDEADELELRIRREVHAHYAMQFYENPKMVSCMMLATRRPAFSMQFIANAVGVSRRTVYRQLVLADEVFPGWRDCSYDSRKRQA